MAKFQHGQDKPTGSGRKRGTPNKRSQLLIESLESFDFSVPEQLISLLPQLDPAKQADVLIDLMSYLYPKRKAVEQTLVETRPDFDRMSTDQLKEAESAICKRLHGFDPQDPVQRKARLEKARRLLQLVDETKKYDPIAGKKS